MSEPNVLVNFRLDKDQPLRLRWLATDGVPGDGYKAQITAIKLMDGAHARDGQLRDPRADRARPGRRPRRATCMTFNGMVGFAADHPDRKIVDALADQEIEYDLEFVHDDSGRRRGREHRLQDRRAPARLRAQAGEEVMRDDSPSRTAAFVAAARQLGALLPDDGAARRRSVRRSVRVARVRAPARARTATAAPVRA